MSLKVRRCAATNQILVLVLVFATAACNKHAKASPEVFASPDDAGNALVAAGKSGDKNALLAVLGPNSKDIVSSGDAVEDQSTVEKFVAAYGTMHRWRKMADNIQILLVGADNFAFPIPLKKNAAGQWFFDQAEGRDEILSRRIGRNELAVIDACTSLADAQQEYFSQSHIGDNTKQYAQRFISDPGKQNGLYWESPEGQPRSPLGPLVALATTEGYSVKPGSHAPFHGYYFRILTQQGSNAPGGAKDYLVDGKMTGGFAFIAYPAEYRNSGVMTFLVNRDDVVLQKDLGNSTEQSATSMTQFDPDSSWTPVDTSSF